jgi:hypothetical protein
MFRAIPWAMETILNAAVFIENRNSEKFALFVTFAHINNRDSGNPVFWPVAQSTNCPFVFESA